MSAERQLRQVLADLRRFAGRRRSPQTSECVPLLMRLLASGHLRNIEERANAFVFRLDGNTGNAPFSMTCFLHHPSDDRGLTRAEAAVAAELCEGRTVPQIARLRGVSANTVKSQVRQIFRKLEVGSRVELMRRLGP